MGTNNNTAKRFKPLKIVAIILFAIGAALFATILMGVHAEKSDGLMRIEKYGMVSVRSSEGVTYYDDEDEFKEYVYDSWYVKEFAILFFSPGVICMGVYIIANRQKKE